MHLYYKSIWGNELLSWMIAMPWNWMYRGKKWFKSPELISIPLKEDCNSPLTPYCTFLKIHANLNQPIFSYKNTFDAVIEIAYDFNVFNMKFEYENSFLHCYMVDTCLGIFSKRVHRSRFPCMCLNLGASIF